MYSFLIDDSSEYEKAKSVIKNVVATIRHNEYKDALLNNKINKLSLSCFDDRIHNLAIDMMEKFLVIRISYKKTVILISTQNSLLVKL